MRIVVILAGIFFLCLSFWAYSRKKMTESMGLIWVCFSILIILSGALPGISLWIVVLEKKHFLMIFGMAFIVFLGNFILSVNISLLIRKNQELAMHVSLLNQENEIILSQLAELTGERKISV